MTRDRTWTRAGAGIAVFSVVMASVALALWALWWATPSGLKALSDGFVMAGGIGLVFVVGVIVGGFWFGADAGTEDDPGRPRRDDDTPPDPPVLPPADLERELEALLSGGWRNEPARDMALTDLDLRRRHQH